MRNLVSKTQRKKGRKGQALWSTPVVPGLRRQRWEDYCKFKANLIYTDVSQRCIVSPASNTKRLLWLDGQCHWSEMGNGVGITGASAFIAVSEGATRRV